MHSPTARVTHPPAKRNAQDAACEGCAGNGSCGSPTVARSGSAGRATGDRRRRQAAATWWGMLEGGGSPSPSKSELHRLDLEELLEAVGAVLAAVAAVLVAAERCARVEGTAVDLDLARADAAGGGLGPVGLRAPHPPRQPAGRGG